MFFKKIIIAFISKLYAYFESPRSLEIKKNRIFFFIPSRLLNIKVTLDFVDFTETIIRS